MTKAVVLLNLGTPAEPTPEGLRDYYRHFSPTLTCLISILWACGCYAT